MSNAKTYAQINDVFHQDKLDLALTSFFSQTIFTYRHDDSILALTSLDLFLPMLLADMNITRQDLARMAEGGLCLNCKACTFPKCPFGK